MAEVITVQPTDTISRILTTKRGLQAHQIHDWLTRLGPLNPHISNLDRIYPGERVLIPDSLHEIVTSDQIWQNAFSHIPPALEQSHVGHRELFFITPGFSLNSIADNMFAQSPHGNLSLSTRRAVLFHNNPALRLYPCAGALPGGMFLDITPRKLSTADIQSWSMDHNFFAGGLQDLVAVFVCAGLKAGLLPQEAVKASQGIGHHRGIGMADVRFGVDVINGRGDVVRHSS